MLTSALPDHEVTVMAKKPAEWTIFSHEPPFGDPFYEQPLAVPHSFGRGKYRELAEKVVVPKIVLDQIIGKEFWTERPRGSSAAAAAGRHGGGAAPAGLGMGGVQETVRAKRSGRGRALNLRREKVTRPGRKVRTNHFQVLH